MVEFKKPPGPAVVHAVVRDGQVIYWAPEADGHWPKRYEIVPYVPQWKKDAAEAEYRNLLEAGESQDEAFEDALVAVKLLADAIERSGGTTHLSPIVAKAKELAPGAWVIKRDGCDG